MQGQQMIHGGCFPGGAPGVMPLLTLLDQFAQVRFQLTLFWPLTCWLLRRLAGCQLLCHLLSLQVWAKSICSDLFVGYCIKLLLVQVVYM